MKMTELKQAVKRARAVAIVTAFFLGMIPIHVHAGGSECTCEEKCTKDHVNCDCDLCKINPDLCCGADPNEEGEQGEGALPGNESRESEKTVPEEPKEETFGPLTPDGNMTLVDDYGSIEAGGKQFITITTKSGNYFYIIIDRDDSGEQTVHFLNMVDEADLLALMDEEAVDQYIAATGGKEEEQPPVVEEPIEPEPEESEEIEVEPGKKKNPVGVVLLILLLAGGSVGGYIYYKKLKEEKPQGNTIDPDADYNEDEEDYLDHILDDEDSSFEVPDEQEEGDSEETVLESDVEE